MSIAETRFDPTHRLTPLLCFLTLDIPSGEVREVRRLVGDDYCGHPRFSITNPNFLSYKGEKDAALEVVDLRTGGTAVELASYNEP